MCESGAKAVYLKLTSFRVFRTLANLLSSGLRRGNRSDGELKHTAYVRTVTDIVTLGEVRMDLC